MLDTEERETSGQIDAIAASLPSMKKKLIIWAVRSAIALALVYAVVAMNGPTWLIPAVWIYIAVSLVIGVGMTLYAQRVVARSRARVAEASDAARDLDAE